MITGIEIPYVAGLLYPFVNLKWWLPKMTPKIEKELGHEPQEMKGIQVYHYEKSIDPPFFINLGPLIFPILGGSHTSKNLLCTNYTSNKKDKTYPKFQQIDDKEDIQQSFEKKTYINNPDNFEKVFNDYHIPLESVPISFPLQVSHYRYKNGFYYHKSGMIASSKPALLKKILWERRMPYTQTITFLAYGTLVASWILYSGGLFAAKDTYYKITEYPPFHYRRIKGYFS